MSDSTTNLDSITVGQKAKETAANELYAAGSRATDFGRRGFGQSAGLTMAFYGTPRYFVNGTEVTKANFSVAITASATRYVSVDRALAATEIATAFAADKLALYKAVTSGSAVASYEDHRDPHHVVRFLYGRLVKAMGDANVTLTYAEAMCESIECTGSNTALRDLIVPLVPRAWTVFANTTTNGVRVIGASGTGTTIAVGKTAIVECDGTNVRRITADNP